MAELGQVFAFYLDGALVGMVESCEKREQSGFSASALAKDGNGLPTFDDEVEVVQHFDLLSTLFEGLGNLIKSKKNIHVEGSVKL